MGIEGFNPTYITASQTITNGGGVFKGFFVNSHTLGTVKVYDSTSASGKVLIDTYSLVNPGFVDCGSLTFGRGLYVELGGTANITVAWAQQ